MFHNINRILISCFVILSLATRIYSQIPARIIESMPTQEVDTNYVNLEENILSLRIFLVAKTQNIKLNNEDYGLKYLPNNRLGAGIGFAYYPILLDFAVNIKVHKENATDRFDLQGEIFSKRSLFGIYLQNYRGFNITGDQLQAEEFRPDIHSIATGLSYFSLVNANKMSFRSIFAGGAKQKKSVGSFALGGTASFHRIKADSSIIPGSQQAYFNEYAQITKMLEFNASIKTGYAQVFVIPHGFFIFAGIFPGIGISVKEITSGETYIPSDWLNLLMDLQISFGYNSPRIYTTIGVVDHYSNTSLDYSNRMITNFGRIKWVVGFKL